MIKKFKTRWGKINFVLRHIWEKGDWVENYEKHQMRKEIRLGVWAKTYIAVGNKKGPVKVVFNKNNHVRGYMIGINLIVCNMWVDISGPTFGM